MYESPGFSRFRELMDIADLFVAEEQADNKLRHLFDSQGMVLFFKKDGEYYGSREDSRVVFAKLKHPDDETPDGWDEEANFTATNLNNLVKGHPTNHVFDKDDLGKIKVVDRDDVIDALKDETIEEPSHSSGIRFIFPKLGQNDRDEAPNFSRDDED